MKNKLLIYIIFACVSLCLFAGCNNGNKIESGDIFIDVKSVAFTIDNSLELDDNASVKDYLDALKENGKLTYDGEDGQYGFYITSVFSTKAEQNSYWAVYTDLTNLDGVDYSSSTYGTFSINGKTLNYANYGVSNLPCIQGYTYALVLEQY